MSCRAKEVSKGYLASNPVTTLTAVAVDLEQEYHVITVFNETDQHIKVVYQTEEGDKSDFIVPKNGRSFTRVLAASKLLNTSLQVAAINSAATGNVIINLGN